MRSLFGGSLLTPQVRRNTTNRLPPKSGNSVRNTSLEGRTPYISGRTGRMGNFTGNRCGTSRQSQLSAQFLGAAHVCITAFVKTQQPMYVACDADAPTF